MRRASVCLASLLLFACGDDVSSAGDDSGTSGTSGSESSTSGDPSAGTTSTTDDTADASTSGGADESSTTDGPPPEELEFAKDIRLDRITVNQATQVTLVADGIEVPGEDYNTRVITGRRTLLRGFWSLHANFEPRDILGRLTIDYPDGTRLEQDFTQFVAGESSDGAGAASFQWLLEPDEVVPGMTYRVRLYEPAGTEAPGELSDPPPVAPLAGPGTLDIYDVPLQIRIVLVPVQHEFEGKTCTPDVTDEDVLVMQQALEQTNPVQRTIFEVREPMVYTESIAEGPTGGFTPVLAALATLRAEDDPDPSVYYYGLLDSCDGFPSGLGGQAINIAGEPTENNGGDRISTGRWNGSGAGAAGTFVHEIGHNQSRRHVRCSGGEAGIDAAYPHAGGRIGVWGFGIHDFELHTPSGGRDYMTYCSSEWVSDYSWEYTLEIIEVLTGFDVAGTTPSDDVVLAGLIHEDGSADWWTQRGTVDPDTALGNARFETPAGPVDTVARVRPVPHGHSARYVEVPLPASARSLSAVDISAPGTALRVGAESIRVIR